MYLHDTNFEINVELICVGLGTFNLDVMHVERNINDNVFKHLFGEKDTLGTKRDMEEVHARPWLWLQRRGQIL
jgi:hypothetical protein